MFSDPDKIVAALGLPEGAHIADMGAGMGKYSIAAARHIGPEGKVFAVEVQEDMVKRLESDLEHLGVENVMPVWGDIEHPGGTRLSDHSIDWVIAANVLFQVRDKNGFLAETKRVLKLGGKILVVDWTDSHGGMGPKPQDVLTETAARELFESASFSLKDSIEAGSHHYGFIAKAT
jgi:ubiquinone/menaquinone biosynthesis C-methylase UbiE